MRIAAESAKKVTEKSTTFDRECVMENGPTPISTFCIDRNYYRIDKDHRK
jgi:hypothetical protein